MPTDAGTLEVTEILVALEFEIPCERRLGGSVCGEAARWIGRNETCSCPPFLRCDRCKQNLDELEAKIAKAPNMVLRCRRCGMEAVIGWEPLRGDHHE